MRKSIQDEFAQLQFVPGDPKKNARAITHYRGLVAVACQNHLCCGDFDQRIVFGQPYKIRLERRYKTNPEGRIVRCFYIAHRRTEKPSSPFEEMFLDDLPSSLLPPKLDVKITFLGGLGQAGANTCVMIQSGQTAILIDCGTNVAHFESEEGGETDEEAETEEIDETEFIPANPDFQPLVDFCAGGGRILGIFLTHAHLDHVGGLSALSRAMAEFDLPVVYGHRFTIAVTHRLMSDQTQDDPTFRIFNCQSIDSQIQLESFLVTPVAMMHSIPGTYGYAVSVAGKEDQGAIFFTGDFKARWNGPEDLFDFRDRLVGLGPIHAVFCDSTNAGFPGWTRLEQDVKQGLMDTLLDTQGRVFITLFSSHMERIETIARLGHQMEKVVSKLGTSIDTYLDAYDATGRTISNLSLETKDADIIIVAGCQANEFSASRRLSQGQWVEDVRIEHGDTVVVSANPIPGRIRSVTAMAYAFRDLGTRVVLNDSFPGRMENFERYPVHVSGHGSARDISFLVRTLFAQNSELVFVPYHCSREQATASAELADNVGLDAKQILLYERNGSTFLL